MSPKQHQQLYLTIARGDRRPWISGCFGSREHAFGYLQDIPESQRTRHTLQALPRRFPLFALEDQDGFRFYSRGEIVNAIAAYQQSSIRSNEDHEYAIVFRFDQPYRPSVPGADEMGAIWHLHITDRELQLDDQELLERLDGAIT